MKFSTMLRSIPFAITLATAFSTSSVLQATPYASGLSESSGTVSFFLNEGSDSVIIDRAGDTQLDLGALGKGQHSFSVGNATGYDIRVSKSTASGYFQTSDDTDVGSNYFSPRGVAVNRNAGSPHFGNIYVSEGVGGVISKNEVEIRDTLDGIFVMGADQSDIIGQVNDGRIGGLDTSSSNSPFKITIAPDDSVYIADWADATGGVYRAPADLDNSSNWVNVLANENRDDTAGGLTDNHGSIPAVWVEGTGANTVLYTMDEDWPDASGISAEGRGDILRYDIGNSTNYNEQPVVQVDDATTGPGGTPSDQGVILNGLMDFVRDEDGTWWTSQYRSDDTKGVPALAHWEDGASEPSYVSGKDPRADGDFDFDTDIDGADFLNWQRNHGRIGDANAFTGDANGDTDVNELDLEILELNYGDPAQVGLVVLDGAYGDIDIHDGLNLLALGARNGEGVYIVDISDPVDPEVIAIVPQAGRVRDVSFDAAGNLYVVSSSTETLRIWSPGGDTVAVTSSDGTFTLNPSTSLAAVPEPSTLMLCLLGLTSGFVSRRRRS